MKTKDLIKIIKNQEFNQQTAQILKQELEKYPYFTPLLVTYLLCLKAIDENLFTEQLKKYSIYISNRHDFIKKLINIDYLKHTNKLNLSPKTDENLDQQIYEHAKKRHEQIVNEIIEPKIDKLRKLSELSKKQPSEQTAGAEQIPETKPTQQTSTTKTQEKTQTTEPEPQQKPEKTVQTSQSTEKQETKAEISIDDIFKKIEELKKQKLQAVSDYQKRVTNVNKLIEEKKVREDIEKQQPASTRQTSEKTVAPKTTEKPKAQKTETSEKQPKTQQNIDIDQQAQEEITNLIEFESSETETSTKPQPTSEKTQAELKTTQDKQTTTKTQEKQEKSSKEPEIKSQPTQKPETSQQPTISEKADKTTTTETQTKPSEEHKTSITSEQTAKIPTPPQQPKKQTQTDKTEQKTASEQPSKTPKTAQTTEPQKNKEKATTQQPQTAEQKPQAQPAQKIETTSKPETSTTTQTSTSQHKTAADRILEEIQRRRQERKKKQQELIDKFLEQQPSIDRTKQPSIQGDLSEPHTKEVEIVTEKMAQIYELQGLYDKAIETYQKLILQKPEKKDYFANKINQLKQKLNN